VLRALLQRLVVADVVGLAHEARERVVDRAREQRVVEVLAGRVLDAPAPVPRVADARAYGARALRARGRVRAREHREVPGAVGRGRAERARRGGRRGDEAGVALAVCLRVRARRRARVRAARVHDGRPRAEVVGEAERARLPAHAEEARVAVARGRVGARRELRAAVGGARDARARAARALEGVPRARRARRRERRGRADRRAALGLLRELRGLRLRAAVREVARLEEPRRARRAGVVEGALRAREALALLGARQRRVRGGPAQRRARRARGDEPAGREGVEGARDEAVAARAEVPGEALAALERRGHAALPVARRALAREDVGLAEARVARVRGARRARLRALRGDRRVLPRARRARDARRHPRRGGERAGGAHGARLGGGGAHGCRELAGLAGGACGGIEIWSVRAPGAGGARELGVGVQPGVAHAVVLASRSGSARAVGVAGEASPSRVSGHANRESIWRARLAYIHGAVFAVLPGRARRAALAGLPGVAQVAQALRQQRGVRRARRVRGARQAGRERRARRRGVVGVRGTRRARRLPGAVRVAPRRARAAGVARGHAARRVRGRARRVREEEALDAEAVLDAPAPRRREAVRRTLLRRDRVRGAEVVRRTLRARRVGQLPLVRARRARPAALLAVAVELEEEARAAQALRAQRRARRRVRWSMNSRTRPSSSAVTQQEARTPSSNRGQDICFLRVEFCLFSCRHLYPLLLSDYSELLCETRAKHARETICAGLVRFVSIVFYLV
jgi:hypothetical protein